MPQKKPRREGIAFFSKITPRIGVPTARNFTKNSSMSVPKVLGEAVANSVWGGLFSTPEREAYQLEGG